MDWVWLPLVALLLAPGQAPPRVQLPPLPLTELDEGPLAAELDNRAFSLTFGEPVSIQDLLLLLVRGTSLSIVPDPSVNGSFIGELKNVTVRQALALILPPLGLDYRVQGSFIRVFPRVPDTRIFDLNFITTERIGASVVGETGVAAVTSSTRGDVFGDLERGVRPLLSDQGSMSIDRQAGLLQVTDFSEPLDRIRVYLDAVRDRVHRQVQIDAQVLEVELNDEHAQSLDWAALAAAGSAPRTPMGASPGVLVRDIDRFLAALAEQGAVSVLASPRLLVLNNAPAVVRGTAEPAGQPGRPEGVTLTLTPQIAQNGMITLSVGPVVTLRSTDDDRDTPDVVAVREADTLARLASGETMVVSGFWREHETRERRSGGFAGGWFGRSTVVIKKRVELLVLLTPTIVQSAAE